MQNAKIVKYSFQVKKKQCYRMNGQRVLTVIVSAISATLEDRGRLLWLVTRACQNTKATVLSYLFLIDK